MTISFRSILMLAAAFLTVIAGALATVQIREKRRPKQSMQALWLYTCILLALGVLTGIPVYVADSPVTLLFGCISCVCLMSAAACANQRIVWDDRGFWYRTVLRRTVHYRYEDIRRIRPVFDSSPFGADLYMRVGNRRIIIDSSMLWGRFTEAYENWQTRNGRMSWRQENRQRFEARYHRHGPFRRKLDRIPGGRFRLYLFTACGLFCVALGVYYIFGMKPWIHLTAGVVGVAIGVAMFRYWYAVAHIDDKPRLIRGYLSVNARIRPDPDGKPKRYRRVKR